MSKLKTDASIRQWLNFHYIRDYTIHDDGMVDVAGNVNLSDKQLEKIPVDFNNVEGDFDIWDNKLTSLSGCPVYVGGFFNCAHNKIISLSGGPDCVGKYFYCNDNQLTSLQYAPFSIGGDFFCHNNPLKSLKKLTSIFGGEFRFYMKNDIEFKFKEVEELYTDWTLSMSHQQFKSVGLKNSLNSQLKEPSGVIKKIKI